MRLRLTFNRTTKQRMLPMDYQYYISAWIYNVLREADAGFADFLHQKGYGKTDTKLYKLFCFSMLNFGRPKLWKEKKLFEINTHEIILDISFDVTEAATNFIKGIFMSQEFYIGDKFNGIDFKVIRVGVRPAPTFTSTMYYALQTPWVVSSKTETDKHPQYLHPGNEQFFQLAAKHLTDKYNSTHSNVPLISAEQIKITRLTDFKKNGFLVKPGTPQQTRVVGTIFAFELAAPVEIHKMIWGAGVSEKSSIGFGWAEPENINHKNR